MTHASRPKQPIMTPEEERFMAFEGVLQWARAVLRQAERLAELVGRISAAIPDAEKRHRTILDIHTECHFFAVAAHQLMTYRDWARSFGLFATVDFSEVDRLGTHVDDLRNMREHVIDYFRGIGRFPSRWKQKTPDFEADASSLIGTLIGGRLDWVAFAAAVQGIESSLWCEPVPYPPMPDGKLLAAPNQARE